MCNQLSRGRNREEVIFVELKKKLSFKGHVCFEPVRQQKVRAVLQYLQRVNPWYHDVLIRDRNVNENFLSIGCDFPESEIGFEVESNHKLKSAANPLRVH